MIRKWLPYILSLYTFILFAAMMIPTNAIHTRAGIGIFTFRLDYWLHFFAFMGLSILFIVLKYSQLPVNKKRKAFYEIYWVFLFSVGIEIIQFYIPDRSFSVKDLISNGIGTLFGFLTCIISWPILNRIFPGFCKSVSTTGS